MPTLFLLYSSNISFGIACSKMANLQASALAGAGTAGAGLCKRMPLRGTRRLKPAAYICSP